MSDDESWREAVHRDLTEGRKRSKRRPQPYDTAQWKQRRAEVRDAVCVLCSRFSLHVPAEVADHVTPARDGGDFDGALQPLCLDCHKIKRVIEGRWRRGELSASELNLATSKEGGRLRAAAFGVGLDGFAICPSPRNDSC